MQRLASEISRVRYLSTLVVLLLLAMGLRTYYLEADAPIELSPTQELNLDGPVTIAAGRDRAVFGEWDPYPGPLEPYRLYPAMSWLSYALFAALGAGYWQANLLSVITGILSVVLIAAYAREHFSRRASLISVLFMSSNYIYVFYNRDPMAYTTVAFGLSLSLFLWGKGLRRPFWFFLSGLVMVFNTLLIKLPGVAILPAALVGFVSSWWPRRRELKIEVFKPVLLYAAGAGLMGLLWLAFIYLPHVRSVNQAYYLRTFNQTTTLLDNIRFAIQSLLFFGVDFGFNLRMLPLFTLSYGYLFYRVGQILSRMRPKLEPAELVALAYLLASVAMLFFSGIRPLRFQIVLIPPMSLVGALAVDAWVRGRRPGRREIDQEAAKTTDGLGRRIPLPSSFGRAFPLYIQIGLAYFFYQVLAAGLMLLRMVRVDAGPVDARVALEVGTLYLLLGIALVLSVIGTFFFLWRVLQVRRPFLPLPRRRMRGVLALAILAVSLGAALYQYWGWARSAEETIVQASRQAAEDFDPATTILAGTYAYTLALEGDLPAVWFYGHTSGDAILASSYTHLAMEAESPLNMEITNDERIRENLPQLMDRAELVAVYELRGYRVNVYRVEQEQVVSPGG